MIMCTVLLVGAVVAEDVNASFEQQEDVVYHQAHGVALVADIFTPIKMNNGHAIVVVASGAWFSDRGKIRDLGRAGLFEELCVRGFHVFAVRPGSISRFSAHDMKEHVEAGIRWVKSRSDDFGFKANRIGLFGASAGGHLASLTAVTQLNQAGENDASVSAVGVFFPPTDFLDFGGVAMDPRKDGRFHQILKNLAFRDGTDGLTDQEIQEQSESISPARLVTDKTPPFIMIHGDADPAVPLQQSQALFKALQQFDVPAKLIVKEGGAHPWPTIREEVIVMADWFMSVLVKP